MTNLPETLGKTSLVRICTFYSRVFRSKYGFSPRISYPRVGGVFKTLMSELSEVQIALLIMLHFEWKGTSGDDLFTNKRLSDNAYPLEWIPRNSNSYEAFIRNNLKIDFDNQEEVFNNLDKQFL